MYAVLYLSSDVLPPIVQNATDDFFIDLNMTRFLCHFCLKLYIYKYKTANQLEYSRVKSPAAQGRGTLRRRRG